MSAPGTKGPWRVAKNASRRVTSAHGIVICNAVLRNQGGPKAKSCLKDEHEAEANANLIAAAPGLYNSAELLDSLCAWLLHRFGTDSPEGREAIFRQIAAQTALAQALARGEPQ